MNIDSELIQWNGPGYPINCFQQIRCHRGGELEAGNKPKDLGCSLQHHSPMIDTRLSEEWKVHIEWSPKPHVVFGKPTVASREKTIRVA
ncbi:hypothetical protein N7462_001859 [Penicillium macrosclerotiorum]|uniref:uncharacterized protein n=1 Tax=Penicillium macrosclerotiorum TaxID=303699 RepID=UPI0025468D44|nr:uncharacterized protein N7462_001859 [Penicillium macrosclerotiorum]KAJ5692436.1 hypothetical protein N7462_001859 [Penicillium macrosclerotiorum]